MAASAKAKRYELKLTPKPLNLNQILQANGPIQSKRRP